MGWIKLFRKVFENFLYFCEPFDKFHAWIDLLLLAQHDEETFMSKGQVKTLSRGQLVVGRKYLAKRWKWSENKVLRFLRVLSAQGMIVVDGTSNGTTLTIVNYRKYQDGQTADGTPDGTTNETSDGTSDGTLTRMYKNVTRRKEGQPLSYWEDRERQFAEMDEWARKGDEADEQKRIQSANEEAEVDIHIKDLLSRGGIL